MTARQPLSTLIGINQEKLSREEALLLEAEIFLRLYQELTIFFKNQYEDYFRFMKFTSDMEKNMLETQFIRLIINDILSTEEYTIQGIAHYTNIHEDVLCELASGLNTKPLAIFFLKLIELHITVRRELYTSIRKKITTNDLVIA